MTPMTKRLRNTSLTLSAAALSLAATTAIADNVILDDLIVDGSICAGLDCVNGESFGFDTLRLKENNLRIKFQDTSASASFPSNDWQITANDSSNGGANKFSIDDIDGGRTPFTIEASAPSHSLYVDDGGRIGFGKNTPVVELHVADGDSPTLRLEQDGTSGFTPQTWDLAGNETNFFVRDVTNGSQLPLRIEPGTASNTLYLEDTESVGVNTANPVATLHVIGNTTNTAAGNGVVRVEHATGNVALQLIPETNTSDIFWNFEAQQPSTTNAFVISRSGTGVTEFSLDATTGNLTIQGGLISSGGGGACTAGDPCDAVFDPSVYTVPSIEEHAALMWEKKHLPAVGPTGPDMPINMTEKMLRMLNELEHAHIYIEQLNAELKAQGDELDALKKLVAQN